MDIRRFAALVSLALALLALGGTVRPAPALAAPVNDNFANAITIATPTVSGIVAVGDNTGATLETAPPIENVPSCQSTFGASIWYTWTSPGGSGSSVFDTYGSSFDTVLAIYTGSAFPLTNAGCNDDFGGSLQSGVAISNSPATTYRIQVGGFSAQMGNLVLNISRSADMVVNSTADNNVSDPLLTLREAMILAENGTLLLGRGLSSGESAQVLNPGFIGFGVSDLIHFDPIMFPPGSPATITLGGTLPSFHTSKAVVSGIGAGVIVDGVSGAFNCFEIGVNGTGNVIEGLHIRRCFDGINIADDSNVVGGGTISMQRNVITGSGTGIRIGTSAGTGNTVVNNYIGTDGVSSLLGNGTGVLIEANAATNTIGSGQPGQGNLISGNANGVSITGSGSDGNLVIGNTIGTNPGGTIALGNSNAGVLISGGAKNNVVGGATAGERNVISGNGTGGVVISGTGSTGNKAYGNYIGTNAAGTAALANGNGVIVNLGAQTNLIGGSGAGQGNVISGNTGSGVRILDPGSNGNTVAGNYIGLNAAGGSLGNSIHGVSIFNLAANNVVGGTTAAARNIISGNAFNGVSISDGGTTGNMVWGNYIGLNAAGSAAIGNTADGVDIFTGASGNQVGGSSPAQTNVISGNGYGVTMEGASGNFVRGNFIGTNAAGSAAAGNVHNGVLLIQGSANNQVGGPGATEGNVISGNLESGVVLGDAATTSNVIEGNLVGTNAAGTAAVANGSHGVFITNGSSSNTVGGDTPGERNVISGNQFIGVAISSATAQNNTVSANYIGLDKNGLAAIGNGTDGVNLFSGAGNNLVGGDSPGERNIISANAWGVTINSSSNNIISGNYIGTNAGGTAAVGNANSGVLMFNGATNNRIGGSATERNVISGNGGSGVSIGDPASSLNVLRGNFIGTDASGLAALGNGGRGVLINNGAGYNRIGDTPTGGNVIAFNIGNGVEVDGPDSDANLIRVNSVHSNGGLGIDLVNSGNDSVPAPVITMTSGSLISGTACPGCTIDVYSDAANEGRYHHATVAATLGGLWGYAGQTAGTNVTATATDGAGNTSEFSAAAPAELCDGVDNDADSLVDEGWSDTDSDGRKDCVDIGKMVFDPAGTISSPTVDCTAIPEDYDAFKDSDGCPEPDNDNDSFPDNIDQCPGSGAVAGANGMLGSPQDLNHNGIQDGAESPLTSDDSVLTFEDYDGVLDGDGCHDSPGDDFDGDGLTDDTEVFTTLTLPYNPDTDGDGVLDGPDNCRLWPNPTQLLPPWPVPSGDSDCDGFTNAAEGTLGTDPIDQCPDNASDDAWPPDINKSTSVSVTDVLFLKPWFGQNVPPAPARYDLVPTSPPTAINITDVVEFKKYFGLACT